MITSVMTAAATTGFVQKINKVAVDTAAALVTALTDIGR